MPDRRHPTSVALRPFSAIMEAFLRAFKAKQPFRYLGVTTRDEAHVRSFKVLPPPHTQKQTKNRKDPLF